MYDTKSRELRWNATYHDYSALLYDEAYDYSESLGVAAGVWRQALFSMPREAVPACQGGICSPCLLGYSLLSRTARP